MFKFVIVGGGGYIGFHIGLDLVSKGHSVVLADLGQPDPEWGECNNIPFEKVNVLDSEALEKVFRRVDCVILCASFGMSGKEQLDWDKTEAVNIRGTMNVIRGASRAGVRGLVYTSTFNVVFGGQEIENGTEESSTYFPLHRHVDHYSRTKAIAEQLILTADGKVTTRTTDESSSLSGELLQNTPLRTCALRLAGVMGLKEKRHLPRIVSNLPMLKFTYGKRESLVQFIGIENVVQAHVKAALGLLNQPQLVGGQAFFVSDGPPINNFEFFRPLIQGLGYTFPSLNLPLWIMWIFSWVSMTLPGLGLPLLTPAEIYKTAVTHHFSNAKAARLLGFVPTKPNDLTLVVEYYQRKQREAKAQSSSSIRNHVLFPFLALLALFLYSQSCYSFCFFIVIGAILFLKYFS